MSQSNQVSLSPPGEMLLNPNDPIEREMMIVERGFEFQQRKAKVYAQSDVVPDQFRGNIANCIIAQEMSQRLQTGVLEIMQNFYVVYGRPAFSSAYIIARINSSGLIKGTLKFNFVGEKGKDHWGCFCTAVDAESGDEMVGPTVDIAMAKAEGWATKNGSKWKTMPEVMLRYRAAAFFGRGCLPQAIMGMHTTEEIHDIEEKDITPKTSGLSSLNESFKPKTIEQKTDIDGQNQSKEPEQDVTKEIDTDEEPDVSDPTEQDTIEEPKGSPPFETLKKELLKCLSVADCQAILKMPAIKRCKADERNKLALAVNDRVKAIELGMLQGV